MASMCRSAAAAARSAALRSRSQMARHFQEATSTVTPPRIRRPLVAAALASLESLMPLHSAVAAARLRSCIAADSACWSCLSQGSAFFNYLGWTIDVWTAVENNIVSIMYQILLYLGNEG